ncbi:MAG: STAS domain-containing protein [Bacteroidia bacterium]|nr:STAS domain-containing protein [Bacteroidia bacterium]
MEIREQINENYTTLCPVGELDANSSIHLDEKISSLIQNGKVHIHVDCRDVSYMSSAGLGVFISHLEEISARSGKLILSNLNPGVFDVFDLLGLNQLVTIAEDGDDIGKYF